MFKTPSSLAYVSRKWNCYGSQRFWKRIIILPYRKVAAHILPCYWFKKKKRGLKQGPQEHLPLPAHLQDLGSQAGGQAWAPVVGVPSPNCRTNREPQAQGSINQSETYWRASSWHQDLALPNCLQAPVLDISGQTTSKTGIQPHPSKKEKNEKTKNYVTDKGTK